MFKGASQNAQHARDSIPAADIAAASAPEVLDVKQQRDALKSAFWAVEIEIERVGKRHSPERLALIERKRDIEAQLAALPRYAVPFGLNEFFRWAAKDVLPPSTYEMIIERAATMKREQEEAESLKRLGRAGE